MRPRHENTAKPDDLEPFMGLEPFTMGDELLDRAKSVARQIEERVRRLTDDTSDYTPLPPDQLEEHPGVE